MDQVELAVGGDWFRCCACRAESTVWTNRCSDCGHDQKERIQGARELDRLTAGFTAAFDELYTTKPGDAMRALKNQRELEKLRSKEPAPPAMFQCPACPRGFKNATALRLHKKQTHK